jgi:hypothetical protein
VHIGLWIWTLCCTLDKLFKFQEPSLVHTKQSWLQSTLNPHGSFTTQQDDQLFRVFVHRRWAEALQKEIRDNSSPAQLNNAFVLTHNGDEYTSGARRKPSTPMYSTKRRHILNYVKYLLQRLHIT